MAIKNKLLLGLVVVACLYSTVEAQTLEGRTECRYERNTEQSANGSISTYQRERCVEEPGQTVRQVRIGDLVRESWVREHPVIKQDFAYRGNRCRWFLESGTAERDLVQYQGIICEVQPNAWRVIDKF
jgi:hypothetical protein